MSSNSDRPVSHVNVFNRDFGDMLIATYEESKGHRAWREAQDKRSESIETWLGQIAGNVGRLTRRIDDIEARLTDREKELLVWKLKTDERLHDLEESIDGRASEVDMKVLQTRISERVKADASRTSVTVAKIMAVGAVIAGLVGAGWFMPTQCSRQQVPIPTQPGH